MTQLPRELNIQLEVNGPVINLGDSSYPFEKEFPDICMFVLSLHEPSCVFG